MTIDTSWLPGKPPEPEEPIETLNQFIVAANGDCIVVMHPPNTPLTKEEALNLAAYLVALADPTHERFAKVLKAIEST